MAHAHHRRVPWQLLWRSRARSRPRALNWWRPRTARSCYGHHHLTVTSVEAHKKFWVDGLGGTAAKLGTNDAVKFTNVIVLFRQGTPTGGTKGTSVNHIGFGVPNIRVALDRVKAAGFPAVTRAELPPTQEVKDDLAFIANQNTSIAYVMAPDDVKVELVEVKAQSRAGGDAPRPLLHAAGRRDEGVVRADARRQGRHARVVPGRRPAGREPRRSRRRPSRWWPRADARSITSGFEVKDLEAFCKKLEAAGVKFDRPYAKVAALGIAHRVLHRSLRHLRGAHRGAGRGGQVALAASG